MFFLSGVARYLFVPLAEAVCFAMLASYLLSRTLVPTMAKYLLEARTEEDPNAPVRASSNPFVRMQQQFEHRFDALRDRYHRLLERCIHHRVIFAICFLAFCVLSFALLPLLGQDFFPAVDSGEFKLHMRAPTGTRIEETAALCDRVEAVIRKQIPQSELVSLIDNIGLPYSSINLSYSNSAPIGTGDADILAELSKDHHPTADYVHDLRIELAKDFPGVTFYFLPADIVSQILNFGLPAPIDIQILGQDLAANRVFADNLLNQLKFVPGTVDLRIQQAFDQPKLHIEVDRTKAQQIGYSARDIAQNLLVSLSGSFQTTPNFWLDPAARCQLQHRRANAAVQRGLLAGSGKYPGHRPARRNPEIHGHGGFLQPRRGNGRGLALQHHAGDRYFWRGARPRPGRSLSRDRTDH